MTRFWMVAAIMAAGLSTARAEDITIGAIYPLTGNAAQIGADAQAAIGVMTDIINTDHAPLPMLLGQGGGLPHYGHNHIRVIFADHQNDPQKARAEAERLITQEHVVALVGSYTSATAATISQVADRYEVPYMSMDNSSPSLNQRGLKWFFRTSPHDEMFTAAMFDFMKAEGEKTGHPRQVRRTVLRRQHLRHRQLQRAAQDGRRERHDRRRGTSSTVPTPPRCPPRHRSSRRPMRTWCCPPPTRRTRSC